MTIHPLDRIHSGRLDDLARDPTVRLRPFVVEAMTDSGALTFEQLQAAWGHVKIPVRDTDDEIDAIFTPRVKRRGVARTMMRLDEYIDRILSPAPGIRPPYAGNISLLNDRAVKNALASMLDLCRFPEWVPPSAQDEYRLWIGAAGQRSTIHNDPYDNYNLQVIGRKRFIVLAPDQHGALYPEFFHAGMWASPIDPAAPDLHKYPAFEHAVGFDCELRPGDLLYLPRYWWHCVEALTPSVNVNRWILGAVRSEMWWHQQPAASRFIDYRALLERERLRFEKLPPDLQDAMRDLYLGLRDDLLRLASGQPVS